jgi:hypothetical protein
MAKKAAKKQAASTPQELGLTPKQSAFLAAYRESGSLSAAARAAKINRLTHYDWLQHEPYRTEFMKARQDMAELLLDEAIDRAIAGSDRLLEFLLRGLKPELFNRQRVEITPSGPGLAGMAIWQLSDEQLEEEIRKCERAIQR